MARTLLQALALIVSLLSMIPVSSTASSSMMSSSDSSIAVSSVMDMSFLSSELSSFESISSSSAYMSDSMMMTASSGSSMQSLDSSMTAMSSTYMLSTSDMANMTSMSAYQNSTDSLVMTDSASIMQSSMSAYQSSTSATDSLVMTDSTSIMQSSMPVYQNSTSATDSLVMTDSTSTMQSSMSAYQSSTSPTDSLVMTDSTSTMQSSMSVYQSSTSAIESMSVSDSHVMTNSISPTATMVSMTASDATFTTDHSCQPSESCAINTGELSPSLETSAPYTMSLDASSSSIEMTSSSEVSSSMSSSSSIVMSSSVSSSESIAPSSTTEVASSSSAIPIVLGRLYPYGPSEGDNSFPTSQRISDTIYFKDKVPFGNDGVQEAHVLNRGAVTFGDNPYYSYPSFDSASYYDVMVAGPFWAYMDELLAVSRIYYHLYERSNMNGDNAEELRRETILARATTDVKLHAGITSFNASTALVATWDSVGPWTWVASFCKYHHYYNNIYNWWYSYYYSVYCANYENTEQNTFQMIYATDGLVAYVIYKYKEGGMTWRDSYYRRIVVGYNNEYDLPNTVPDLTYTSLTTTIDVDSGNTVDNAEGVYIFKVGEYENPIARCFDFVFQNYGLVYDSSYHMYINNLYQCPCALERLGRQWWWHSYKFHEESYEYTICYGISPVAKARLLRLSGNPLNKLCCYRYKPPLSSNWWYDYYLAFRQSPYIQTGQYVGRVLGYDPWWWQSTARSSIMFDFRPHEWCCVDSLFKAFTCSFFHIIRPAVGCSWDAVFVSGRALGDPHIKSLDGVEYTFNGWGEYILLKVDSEDFQLQGRTDRVLTAEGDLSLATVFVAFAAQEGEAHFQAKLNGSGGMEIFANQIDITARFYNQEEFDVTYNDTLGVKKTEQGSRITAEAVFPSGLTLKVHVGNQNMEFTLQTPLEFRNQSAGMFGNFNNDTTDEFITASGINLGQNLTERVIFEDFAETWEVTTVTSIFIYGNSETALDYQHPEFEPIFIEEANQTLVADAKTFCGADKISCIYDFIATGDESFAAATLNTSVSNDNEDANLANTPPSIKLTGDVFTEVNSTGRMFVNNTYTYTITVQGTDNDGDAITYQLTAHNAGSDLTIDSATGVITYTVNTSIPVSIGVQAVDTTDAVSTVLTIPITACTLCSNGKGQCHASNTREGEFEDGNFILRTCLCGFAWTGVECQNDTDGCSTNPCIAGQDCFDIPAASQTNATGYTCGPCPTGYEEVGEGCSDVNECSDNTTCTNAVCANTDGSYTCTCNSGYRETTADPDICEDIDECLERSHNCSQKCTNNEGSFDCSCLAGYSFDSAGACIQDPSLSDLCNPLGCNQLCINNSGSIECACEPGYSFPPGNNKTCEDVDECTSGVSPCEHLCSNTVGGFTCSCRTGFKLNTDEQSCAECMPPNWGDNCQSRCRCSGRGSCNSKQGCICISGYTGVNCSTDINECVEDPNICDVTETCSNTPAGSHTCSCSTGYSRNSAGNCVDVDECASVLTHDCDLAVQACTNNEGSYRCDCITGFSENSAGVCEDIDECTSGTHDCEQTCKNVPGLYNCECEFGYALQFDRISCSQVTDICAEYNMTCDHGCSLDRATETAFCFCNAGYMLVGDSTCQDINECDFDHLNLCEVKDLCVNSNGTFACSCDAGTKLDNNGRTCSACTGGTWGKECNNSCACSVNADRCDLTLGCICNSGFSGTFCEEDIDECDTGRVTCSSTQECENIPGSARCICLDGYEVLDSSTCTDVDECAAGGSNDCSQGCTNVPGSFICTCFNGYTMNNSVCIDVDECDLGLDSCEQTCVNMAGRYRCECSSGFELAADGASCDVSAVCGANNCTDICAVVETIDTCFCSLGTELDISNNETCNDVDLCLTNNCAQNCRETNSNTTKECYCNSGFLLENDGFSCSACPSDKYGNNCAQNCTCIALSTTECNAVNGSCTCESGWEGSDCGTDVDECTLETHTCPANSNCINTDGSFVCQCNNGYVKANETFCQECSEGFYGEECAFVCQCDQGTCDKTDGSCACFEGYEGTFCDTDIDECLSANNCTLANRANWVCSNLRGTYECKCDDGYEDDGTTCNNIDECASDVLNQCNQICTDTDGFYECSCNSGYTLNGTFTCLDDDECSVTNPCEQICTNTPGTFECSCNTGFDLDTDNSTCFASAEYPFTMTLAVSVTNLVIDPAHSDYANLIVDLTSQLEPILRSTVVNFFSFIINTLTRGSLIIDATTIVRDSGNHRGTMTDALIALAQSNITVNNQTVTPTVVANGIIVNVSMSPCELIAQINPCPTGTTCVESNGSGECISNNAVTDDDDDLDIPLIVGLCIGMPLLVAIIALIIILIYLKKKNKKLIRVASREGHYNDNISRRPSGSSNGGLLLNEDKW